MKRLFGVALACVSICSQPSFAREFDAETGLIHMRARDYDPQVGRFLQEDPVPAYSVPRGKFQPQDMNLFAYVRNSPLVYIDPFGLRPLTGREKELLGPYIPAIDLQNADLHDDGTPWYLPRGYIGITRGNDIYFRPGVYDSSTREGIALLGHELVHVGQYREGVSGFDFLMSYRRGYWRSRYELSAREIEARILQELPLALPPIAPSGLSCP